jgi:hypothetical protein
VALDGFFARVIERSFLFDVGQAERVHAFVARHEQAGAFSKRTYEIRDSYFDLDWEGRRALTTRIRREHQSGRDAMTLLVECAPLRMFISERPPADVLRREAAIEIRKPRTDWTKRFGARLHGRHYGSFARVSIDGQEQGRMPGGGFAPTYPGMGVIEFEHGGCGRVVSEAMLGDFVGYCRREDILLRPRIRGLKGRAIKSASG